MVPLVAAHHERLDGPGYYRGLRGAQIPLGARIIAVADRFDDFCHDTPDQPALDPAAVLEQMRAEVGSALCPDAYQALVRDTRADAPDARGRRTSHARAWPADLTDREVEILRLLTRGLNQREMAAQLSLSEHTVRHHLEHIYNKVGVSTRVGATLFAVEHDLLP
jgi:DNA-binding CsgD family transcriptional regulator